MMVFSQVRTRNNVTDPALYFFGPVPDTDISANYFSSNNVNVRDVLYLLYSELTIL